MFSVICIKEHLLDLSYQRISGISACTLIVKCLLCHRIKLGQEVLLIRYVVTDSGLDPYSCLKIIDRADQILELLGINTASVLTVVGAAGLAVGLALKDTLSNIAAGIFLLTQHPYKTGDFVECAGMSGSILEIGLFTTKLRTPQGQDIFVPNNSIIAAPITNYSSNKVRRVDITVGIDYGDNLEDGIKLLQAMMDRHPLILKDPAPTVLVAELADSSVNLTLRFWTENDKYWDAYWDIQRNLKAEIEGAGLNIPFPQRVVTFANKAE